MSQTKSRMSVRAFMFSIVLAAPFAVTGCSHASTQPGTAAAPTGHATMAAAATNATAQMPDEPTTAVRDAAWNARPAYTHDSARTEMAYRYALDHPNTLKWLPCYCGCGAMDHRSNLDCYFEPRTNGSISFEEHASYCDICVDITLKAKQLIASGAGMLQVRDAIDAEFGGRGPGTDTARPVS